MECQKHLFSLPNNIHYLNGAFMSPLLQKGSQAGIAGLLKKENPSTITPVDFFETANHIRRAFSKLINSSSAENVAIIPAVSYGISIVVKNTSFSKGDNVVLLHEQFPSNVYAWHQLQQEGVEVRTVAPPNNSFDRGKQWNEAILNSIDKNTRIVALPQIHWADGTVFDLISIGERARAVGALFVIDGTQSIGAFPFDQQQVQADAVICAGYKWLLGPYSVSVAYFGEKFHAGKPLENGWMSRKGSENFGGLVNYEHQYKEGALRYDMGQYSNFALLPVLLEGLRQANSWNQTAVQDYCHQISFEALTNFKNRGYWIEEDEFRAKHIFGVRLPKSKSLETTRKLLHDRHIIVSVRGDAIRVSPHVYNTKADFDALEEALIKS